MTDPYNQPVAGHAQTDIGLRNFMLGTYRYMAMAMAVTAVVAYIAGQVMISVPQIAAIVYNPIVLLGFVISIPFLFGGVARKLPSMTMGGTVTFLFGFAAYLGVFMAAIGLYYNPMVIVKIFLMTVAMFGTLSMFGYTTKVNLWAYAKYAIAIFIGYVAINVIGMFFSALAPTGTLDMIITAVALVAIAIIAAWKTQSLKQSYYQLAGHPGMTSKMSAFGAAMLLLSFVNMFQILLSLFGNE